MPFGQLLHIGPFQKYAQLHTQLGNVPVTPTAWLLQLTVTSHTGTLHAGPDQPGWHTHVQLFGRVPETAVAWPLQSGELVHSA